MLSYRYMPKSNIPFENQLTKLIDNPDVTVNRFQAGGYAITPEFRFYAHKNMVGFYMAPYARFAIASILSSIGERGVTSSISRDGAISILAEELPSARSVTPISKSPSHWPNRPVCSLTFPTSIILSVRGDWRRRSSD